MTNPNEAQAALEDTKRLEYLINQLADKPQDVYLGCDEHSEAMALLKTIRAALESMAQTAGDGWHKIETMPRNIRVELLNKDGKLDHGDWSGRYEPAEEYLSSEEGVGDYTHWRYTPDNRPATPPDGFVMVPVEPNEQFAKAFRELFQECQRTFAAPTPRQLWDLVVAVAQKGGE